MATINAFEINGVIDTNQNVLSNIHSLCEAAGCWLSYDITTGLWSVVINSTGSSTKSFTDSNIIGAINVTGTGINQAYNKVSVEFPHKDLRDQTDYVDLEIPEGDRFPNELDNTLSINLKLTNDPVQAQYIGTVQLKQSRVDRIVEFRTDYTSLGLRAGDLIDITSSMYGFTNKVFRITKLVEEDADDGSLNLSVTALEYSADVYNTGGLVRSERLKKTGITPKSNNAILSANDINNTRIYSLGGPNFEIIVASASTSAVQTAYRAHTGSAPTPFTGFTGDTNESVEVAFSITDASSILTLNCYSPFGTFSYGFNNGGTTTVRSGTAAYIPTEYRLYRNVNGAGYTLLDQTTSDWQTQNISFALLNQPALCEYVVNIRPLLTYDFTQNAAPYIFPYNATVSSQTSGGGFTVVGQRFTIAS